MHSPFSVGDVVSVRGAAWLLRDVVEHPDCVALSLTPAHTLSADTLVVLHPADHVEFAETTGRVRAVSRRTFWRSLAARAATLRSIDTLATPARAAIDLLPFQLAPAVACVLGGRPRLLLADAVGLGKTIEAGVIAAELLARDEDARVLILVPAGLRDQWRSELEQRFRVEVTVVDADTLRGLAASSASTLTPWSIPNLAVVSIDFAKRPEVLAAMSHERWDLLIVDEAHMATADSDRHRAVRTLAAASARTILVTATPHSGDDAQYAALIDLGSAGPNDGLMVFRRSRPDVGLPQRRRSTMVLVRPNAAETTALAGLLAYAREAWSSGDVSVRLLVAFLLKRALSNPGSLALTLARRLALLDGLQVTPSQLPMPWPDEDDGADAEPAPLLARPALGSRQAERQWLQTLIGLAEHAAATSTKLAALGRFVRRAREPILVFTEFRDTLDVVAAALTRDVRVVTLHGGLETHERRRVVEAFNGGRADVLVTTDTGGVGLNLHERCRTVVQLELPWNPVRMEQRIGRVDRLGQRQIVHAMHLVARGTPEARVLARLAVRSRRARVAVDGDTPTRDGLFRHDDEQVAAAVLGLVAPDGLWLTAPLPVTSRHVGPPPVIVRDDGDGGGQVAAQETRRRLVRRLNLPHPTRAGTSPGVFVRWGTRDRVRGAGRTLGLGGRRALVVFDMSLADVRRRLVDEHLVAIELEAGRSGNERLSAPALVDIIKRSPVVRRAVEDAVAARTTFVARRLASMHDVLAPHRRHVREQEAEAPFQAGLFDRRAERQHRGTRPVTRAFPTVPESPALTGRPRLAWVWWPDRD